MTTIGVFGAVFDEAGHILCVHQNYGQCLWTSPGGRLEPGETPMAGMAREVREETGFEVVATRLIALYHAPWRDDHVMWFATRILGRADWAPDDEITAAAFFHPDALPDPVSPFTRLRVADALVHRPPVVRVIGPDGIPSESLEHD